MPTTRIRPEAPAPTSPTRPPRKRTVLPVILVVLGLAIAGGWLLLGSGSIPRLARVALRISTSTHTPTTTYTPTRTPSVTPTFTQTYTPTSTPEMIETLSIGESVQGRPLGITRLGRGERVLVIAAAIHGNESGTTVLAEKLRNRFEASLPALPADVAIYVLPAINPDGVAGDIRFNAHDVDLNRNWQTADWRPDPEGPYAAPMPQGGGAAPFSEPETAALAQWLLDLKGRAGGGVTVVFYHSSFTGGSVQPAYTTEAGVLTSDPESVNVAWQLVNQLGYNYLVKFPSYNVTGNEVGWCAENGLVCVEIEMPTASDPTDAEIDLHFRALWKLIGGQ